QTEEGHRRAHAQPAQRFREIEDVPCGDGIRLLQRGGAVDVEDEGGPGGRGRSLGCERRRVEGDAPGEQRHEPLRAHAQAAGAGARPGGRGRAERAPPVAFKERVWGWTWGWGGALTKVAPPPPPRPRAGWGGMFGPACRRR